MFLIKMAFCPAGSSFVVYRNPADEFDIQIIKLPDMNTGNIYIGKCVLETVLESNVSCAVGSECSPKDYFYPITLLM